MVYERKISTTEDVKELYDYVVGDPSIEAYRGFVEGDRDEYSYGWDPFKGEFVYEPCKHYFLNPGYSSSAVEITYSFDELLSSVEDKTVI